MLMLFLFSVHIFVFGFMFKRFVVRPFNFHPACPSLAAVLLEYHDLLYAIIKFFFYYKVIINNKCALQLNKST